MFVVLLLVSTVKPFCAVRIPDKLHFKHLSIENGLSDNTINRIIEDSYGFIWIATANGLNKYDGLKITVYYNIPQDSSSIPSNEVADMAIDQSGNLWIGAKKGLCRYDYETDKFVRYLQHGEGERNYIHKLYCDKTNQLWVGTQYGLFKFNSTSGEFVHVSINNELVCNAIISFTEVTKGTILGGTWEKGLLILNENQNYLRNEVISIPGKTFEINSILAILYDKNNTVWLATRQGLVLAHENPEIGSGRYSFSLFEDKVSPATKNTDNSTHDISVDTYGCMWIATEYGLKIYDPETKSSVQFFNNPTDPNSLSNNHIKCLYKDRNGNMWLGTRKGGVNIYHPNLERFSNFFPIINNSFDQKAKYVKSIFQDCARTIWVGTDMGLLKFSETGKWLTTYSHSSQDLRSLNIGGVSAILEDTRGRFWVGTWGGGLHEMNRKTGKFKRLPYTYGDFENPKSQGDINVSSIAEDSQGNIWIGNLRGYLDKYNPETKKFEHYKINLEEVEINAIILGIRIDKFDNLWIGTSGAGLIKFDTETKKLIRFWNFSKSGIASDSTLNSSDVFSLIFSDENHLWIGTGNGVHLLDIRTNKFKLYTTDDGLPSNTVYSILPDDSGNIWMSTLKGISRFNPVRNVFINFDSRDGIRINSECGFKSSSGWLFFGGVNGINAINPASLKENLVVPPIVFTDFKVFNKSIEISEKSLLTKNINLTDKITINYHQNVFSIEFAALNYINTEKNQYKCKLEGFDKDWVKLGSENEARYTNLNPGKYVFRVIASNNDGVWNEKGRVLEIEILPPWWKTWWSRIISLLALFLIIVSWLLFRTFRLREQQKKLKKLVLERTAEIETQKLKLQQQADTLKETNLLLIEKQNEVLLQKEAIARQNEKLEVKNRLLEEQKNQISEQRHKELELAGKLHEADQLKLRFFTNISHEFRTPLTLILGPIEKILSKFNSNVELNELGKLVQRNTLRLLNLINQFLDLSRFEAGVVQLNITKGDIFTYIREIVNAYKYVASQKNIEYFFVSAKETHTCFFDADKIEKILYNLLSNAFKFTPQNGKITVSVELHKIGSHNSEEFDSIQIVISDNGKGIPSDKLNRIFERFYQVDTEGKNQLSGTGIGLALTHDLISVYRGTIQVESSSGEGTTFVVNLPIDADSFKKDDFSTGIPIVDDLKYQLIAIEGQSLSKDLSDNVDFSEHPNEKPTGKTSLPGLLIVDDNRDIRKYLTDELGQEYSIIEARDGNVGLEKAIKYLPKLIICDVMMPGMNGYELCAMLKTELLTCHIPVIILTAKASTEDKLESIETGADAYIAKPFDIRLLETQIRQLISSREQLKRMFSRELTIGPTNIVVDSSDETLMNRIIKVMSENVSNPDFGVEELGKEVGLSRTHLYRKIKQLTNHTAIEFVRNMRLQRAAQLFRQNKLYVAEVTYMSGFKELSYFRKIFKEYYGVSPQEYINNCIKNN
jgi:signal transduction histidine kinase/ligand-binding sensor domain-containing protein/DNA-binding response OmpR family regulator